MCGERQPRRRLKMAIIGAGFDKHLDFAASAGVSSLKISRYVNGWEFPSDKDIKGMAKALKIKKNDLIDLL